MIKKVAAIVALVMIASLSAAGCTSSSTNTGTTRSVSAAANATANATSVAGASPSAGSRTPSVTPSVTPSMPAVGTPTLTLTGPATISNNEGGYWQLYINGQIPTEAQAAQISWSSTNPAVPQSELNAEPTPYGMFNITINGAVNTAPGTYSITATYQGVSASATYTRIANVPAFTLMNIQFPLPVGVVVVRNSTYPGTCRVETVNGQGPINGGTVTVRVDGATIASGSPTPDASSEAIFAFTVNTGSMSLGTHTLSVSYSGTSQYAPSSTSETFNIE